MKMLDVFGGDNIKDFEQLKASGMPICTKVSEGRNWYDKYYDYRYNECKKRGIPISFYHMLTKNPDVEGQAVDFWEQVKNYDNEMLNMLDIEYENIPNAEEYANRFIAKYKELSGQDILVYSYRCYFQERFSQSFLNSHYLWVADYCSTQPNFPNLVVWQYSESCKDYWWVGNDEGCVDINNVLMEDVLFRHEQSIPVVTSNTIASEYQNEYEQHGNAEVLVSALNVRTAPSLSAEVVAQYHRGEVIRDYNYVYDRDGYRWIRYVGSSGNYRYVAVRDLSDNHKLCNCY